MSMRLLVLLTALVLLCSGCATTSPPDNSAPPVLSAPELSIPEQPESKAPPMESTPEKIVQPERPAPQTPAAPVEETIPSADVPPPATEPPVEAPAVEEPLVEAPSQPDVPTIHIPDTRLTLANYDFSAPVPESPSVDAEYFADAAFVGDSRTEGFWLYSGVKQGKLLSATGLTVFSVNSKTAINSNQTVLQALTGGNFGKIYLAFGVNELGYIDTDSFVQTYCELIDTVRAAHPNAVIYIQNLIPVNDAQARTSGHKGHVNCDRIRLYNEFIARIAQEKQVPLLDLYSAFVVDGQLPAEASRDGVHLLPDACKRQLNYLMTHTILPAPPTPAEPSPEPPVEMEVTEI